MRTAVRNTLVVIWLAALCPSHPAATPPGNCGSCGHNSAVMFEGVWTFLEPDGRHVAWVVRGEHHTLKYVVHCLDEDGKPVAFVEILPRNLRAPGLYDVLVPSGSTFLVSEMDARSGNVSESRRASFSDHVPNAVSVLRTNSTNPSASLGANTVPSLTGPSRIWATPGASSGGGVDFVVYGDRSDFFYEAFPMLGELANLGYEITAWQGSESWQDAQLVAQDAFEHNADVDFPRLPTLVILGSAYEQLGSGKNQVGTVYYEDETGECPLGTCASDAKIVDFDDDDIPDMPWTRVLGRSQADIRYATEAAIRYLSCGEFGPQRAVLLDGDVKFNCQQVDEPRASVERIRDQLQAFNTPSMVLHESNYLPCDDWSVRRNLAISVFSEGLTELVGLGYLTDRRHFPGGFLQDVYSPKLQITDLPFPQLFVAELFACGSGDEDAINSLPDKLLVEAFMTSDPDAYPAAVAWLGNRRGGYLRNHMLLAETYFSNKLASDGTSTLQEILFDSILELSNQEPALKNHLLLTTAFGWPTWPSRRCVPSALVTASSSNQGHSTLVTACPYGDADTLIVSVDFADQGITGDFAASEIVLDPRGFGVTVFDSDGILPASSGANAPLHKTTIKHRHFGGCAVETVDVLLNGFPLASQATVTIRSPDIDGSGVVNLVDFAAFGLPHFPRSGVPGDCGDFNNDSNVNVADFAVFALHNNHVSPFAAANSSTLLVQSSATVVLHFTEEYPTATTHRLYVDVGVEEFTSITASLFALVAGNQRVTFDAWEPAEGASAVTLFTPIDRSGQEELYFGLLETGTIGQTANLGRLSFDVLGTDPLAISAEDFQLTAGEVLIQSGGEAASVAQMSGVLNRTLAPIVKRVYHNRLEQNFPNPFNPTTTLAFSIKNAGSVNLTIYDVAGRRVRELVNEHRDRGAYKVVWDGRNDHGVRVSSGVYFYKFISGSFTHSKKMTMLK